MKMQFFLIPVVSLTLLSCERTDKAPPTPPPTPTPPQSSFMTPDRLNTSSINDTRNTVRNRNNTTIHQPDNTRVNVRDRDSSALTPFDQSESKADLNVTQKIRQAIMADSTLSTNAKNIKIITINGVVTLRGPVANTREKDNIANKVSSVNGVKRVDNQLEITR